jgi:hypothetical protein
MLPENIHEKRDLLTTGMLPFSIISISSMFHEDGGSFFHPPDKRKPTTLEKTEPIVNAIQILIRRASPSVHVGQHHSQVCLARVYEKADDWISMRPDPGE